MTCVENIAAGQGGWASAVPQFPNERDSRWHLVVGGGPAIPKKDGVCRAFVGLLVSFGIVGDCPNEISLVTFLQGHSFWATRAADH